MSAKMPPVPPGSVSPKGPADPHRSDAAATDAGPGQKANPDKVGQTANTTVNTTNQGLQQDR